MSTALRSISSGQNWATSRLDPAAYTGPLRMTCDDGADIELLVVQYSDRHLTITGRLVSDAPGATG